MPAMNLLKQSLLPFSTANCLFWESVMGSRFWYIFWVEKIGSKGAREFGRARLQVKQAHPLFDKIVNVGETIEVWMSHGDFVETLPKGFVSLGATAHAPFAVIGDDERRFYGVQFHPEMVHTQKGKEFLQKLYLQKLRSAKVVGLWNPTKIFAIEKNKTTSSRKARDMRSVGWCG